MEKFQISIQNAKKNIRIADHMLVMTYPLIKDPKLLLSVLENINQAITNSISSILEYERIFKRIPPYQESFDSKLNMFRSKIMSRYGLNQEYLNLILEVNEILREHKKSPIEFSRDDRFVICSENYRMKTVGIPDLKKNIAKTKMFINQIELLVSKNAGIFK